MKFLKSIFSRKVVEKQPFRIFSGTRTCHLRESTDCYCTGDYSCL